jgi:predicted transcriptional regulator of viral defense system
MKYDVPAGLLELARWQAGAISRKQLLDAGLKSKTAARRLRCGRWQQLHRGVYAVFTGPPSRETWLWAAVLRAGPGAVLSHLSAAELHGFLDRPAEIIFVTIPSTRRIEIPGLIVRTSARIAQACQPNRQPPRTTVEETTLDLAEDAATFDDAVTWITRACSRRLTTAEKLRSAMAARKKMRWRTELSDVLAATSDGVHLVLEYRYLRDVERAHGLPTSRRQVRVVIDGRVVYRDAYYEKYRVAIELDGRAAHPDDERWRDHRRDLQAAARAIVTYRLSWRNVDRDACETAGLLARALRQRGWKGQPKPCSPRCPVGRTASRAV